MGASKVRVLGRLGVAMVLGASLGGCIDLPPIELTLPIDAEMSLGELEGPISFTVNLGGGYAFGDWPGAAGFPLQGFESPSLPLPGFPSENDLIGWTNGEIAGGVVTDVAITEVTLESIDLTASEGDFGTLEEVSFYFVPKPAGRAKQGRILLGSAVAPPPFGSAVSLTPPEGVDLLQLVRDNDANAMSGQPSYVASVSGTVPEHPPRWDTTATFGIAGDIAIETPEFEICDLPSRADIKQMIEDVAGRLLARLVTLRKIEFVHVTLTATENDFGAIEELYVYYVPKAVDGVEQTPIELAGATSAGGFGTEIVMAPQGGEPLDFLALIDADAENPAAGCPRIYLAAAGSIPDVLPSWQIRLTVNVYVRLGLGR